MNDNSEIWNKEPELNTFWFWEEIDWQAWIEDWKKLLLDVIGKGKRQDFSEGALAGFELLDLITEGIKKEKLIRFVIGTDMDNLGV